MSGYGHEGVVDARYQELNGAGSKTRYERGRVCLWLYHTYRTLKNAGCELSNLGSVIVVPILEF